MALLPVEKRWCACCRTQFRSVSTTSASTTRPSRCWPAARRVAHQPPFPASAMDSYAVRAADLTMGARLTVVAERPPAHHSPGLLNRARRYASSPVHRCRRIADTILIRRTRSVSTNRRSRNAETVAVGRHIRRAGLDFAEGEALLDAGRVLDAAALSLAAANHASVKVWRRPLVALIATGDELPPGSQTRPGQIIASNSYGVASIARAAGADIRDLGIGGDDRARITARIQEALDAKADIVVTLGGASVGDHDLVNEVLTGLGMRTDFWKIAMRPGKPLMFGRLGSTRVLGLPGNPVSTLVCGHLFLKPLVALAGRPFAPDMREARLGSGMDANDQQQDYVRARISIDAQGLVATPFTAQDSSMLKLLADANGLVVQPPHAPLRRPARAFPC